MINVDQVTASRLIFAPMGVFLGKCCENTTLKIACGRSPMLGIALQQGAQAIEGWPADAKFKQRPEAHGHAARVSAVSRWAVFRTFPARRSQRLQRRLACCEYFWSRDAEGTTVRRDCLMRSPA
jgi:hypothetical protein